MQLQKIKKVCLAEGRADLLHTECGDWIVCGGAMYSCDGLSLTPDMLAALWGLTTKERDSLAMSEYTPADIGLDEEAVSTVSDGSDAELALQERLEAADSMVRIYTGRGEPVYLREELLAPVEKKDGVAIGLRRVTRRGAEKRFAVAMEGYIATGLFYAGGNGCELARAVRRRIDTLSALTEGVRLEEGEE